MNKFEFFSQYFKETTKCSIGNDQDVSHHKSVDLSLFDPQQLNEHHNFQQYHMPLDTNSTIFCVKIKWTPNLPASLTKQVSW